MVREIGAGLLVRFVTGGLINPPALASGLLQRGYRRAEEAAADRIAIEALIRTGVRASGLRRLFGRFAGQDDDGTFAWLSTHPTSLDRAAAATIADDTGKDDPFTVLEWWMIRRTCSLG